jgi:hypothetical protein
MKLIKLTTVTLLILGFSLFLVCDNRIAWSAEGENHCFTCHTNARGLIKITREIAEAQKGKTKASSEVEGEG